MSRYLLLLSLAAVAVGEGPGQAQHFSAIKAETRNLPSPLRSLSRPGGPSKRLAGGPTPTSASFRLSQSGPGGLARLEPATGTGTELSHRLMPVRSLASRHLGMIRDGLGSLQRPEVPHSLVPKTCLLGLQSITEAQLDLMADLYHKIEAGNLDHVSPRSLNRDELRQGIALPNGWVVRFNAKDRYSIFDRASGRGFSCHGDPHISADVSGSPERETATQYGDWEHDCIVVVLPQHVILIALSTGGGAKNGYGLPTEAIVLSDHQTTYVQGLNTDNPTGYQSGDASFVFKAYENRAKGAPVLFWESESGELRKGSGERPAPPANARDYGCRVPALSRDAEQTSLCRGDFRLVAGGDQGTTDAADLHLQVAYRQALSATKSPLPAVQASGKAYVAEAKTYARGMLGYIEERVKLVAHLESLQRKLEKLHDDLRAPDVALEQAERLTKELDSIKTEAKKTLDAIKAIDARGNATPGK